MTPAERIMITIRKDGTIFLDKTSVTMEALSQALRDKLNREVFLKADKDVPYGIVVAVMGELREIGIEKLGMVTEPKARIQ